MSLPTPVPRRAEAFLAPTRAPGCGLRIIDPEAVVSDLPKCLGARSLLPHRLAVTAADRGCFCHGSGHGSAKQEAPSETKGASDLRFY
jgi:hypothetical protein